MKAFNAFQLVVLFACLPFLIGWLYTNPFPFARGLLVLAAVSYAVEFVVLCMSVYDGPLEGNK